MAPLIATAGLNILLFLGTVRQPRNADRVLKFVKPLLEERNITLTILGITTMVALNNNSFIINFNKNLFKPVSTSREIILDLVWTSREIFFLSVLTSTEIISDQYWLLIDPLELKLDRVVKPIQYYNRSAESPPQSLLDLQAKIKAADGFVVVTAEYHGSIAPGLLNVMNQFPPNSYAFRPSAIVSYSKGMYKCIWSSFHWRSACLLTSEVTAFILKKTSKLYA